MRAVLFDLDGTLVDSERHNVEAVTRVLGRRGRRVSDEERAYVIGHGWREIYARLSQGGIDVPFEELVAAASKERERLVEEEGLLVLPGAVEAVRRVATRAACAVVSGSSRAEIAATLAALHVEACFRFFIGAEDTARGKPDPDGYLLAAERLQVAPDACVVIEESAAGIFAAKAAGMRCIAVRAGNFAGQDQSGANLIIDSLLELDERLIERVAAEAS